MTSQPVLDPTPGILTPDQRPRVFISSTLAELAPERLAARRAVESLRLIPVMFELGARPHPARSLYRAYLAQSHIFIGLYGERYGWVSPGEQISGLEDEYRLSGDLPGLVYLKAPAPGREERLAQLLDRIRDDDRVSYKSFGGPQELERLLREDLAVLLAERFILGDVTGPAAQLAEPASAPSAGPVPSPRLPPLPRPLTELVGRDAEVEEVVAQVTGGARLVTLVGPGGIGKTRVVLEASRQLAAKRPDEVAFVALDTVRDPGEVLPTIGAALGIGLDEAVPATDALGRALRDRSLLLVLDNMEQVLAVAPEVSALLATCPGLSVLATSRAPLRVRGERQVPVGPLALPNGDPGAIDRYAAVRLFLDRAHEVRPGLSLDDPTDAAAVAELTRRLEGIPLALELAAARSRTLPPSALLRRVNSALDLGSGAVDVPQRQRTLRDTVAWSEELLPPQERLLLGELSLFEGPWTLEDAEAIASDDVDDVIEAVAGLVENSLAYPSATARGEPRFRLYEAVRAYARQRLADDARAASEGRYIQRMAEVIRDLDPKFRSPEHARWRSEFRLVWPDVRTAFELALAREDAAWVGPLSRSWVGMWMDGRVQEVQDLLDRALALAEREQPDDLGGVVLSCTGMAFNMGDYDRARELLGRLTDELTLPVMPELPELPGTLELYRGYLAAESDLVAAADHLGEAIRMLDQAGPGGAWVGAFAHNGMGSLLALSGDLEAADQELRLSGDIGRKHGNVAAQMQAWVFLAAMRVQAGDPDEAARLLTLAAEVVQTYPYYEGNAYCVEVAGAVAFARGAPVAAAEALGMGQALRDVVGARVWPLLAVVRALIEQNVRGALDPAEFAAAVSRGREVDLMTLHEVVRSLVAPREA